MQGAGAGAMMAARDPASAQTPLPLILRIKPSSTRYLLSQTVPSASARLASSQFRGKPIMQFKLFSKDV